MFLTILFSLGNVKWIIAVVLNDWQIFIIRAFNKFHMSIQQGFRVPTINYCKKKTEEKTLDATFGF